VFRRGRAGAFALAVALLPLCAAAKTVPAKPLVPKPGPGALPPVPVRDLYYGDALFYFYQDDFYSALTHLTAAQASGRLAHHGDDAELLLGGLYLSLGQHRDAGQIFEEVLKNKTVPAAVRDRARFFLGKVWYQRGYFDKAAESLANAGSGGLTPSMNAERQMLLAQALLAEKRYSEAVAVLDHWQVAGVWQAYAQFNLGVALVRNGQLDAGAKLLDTLGKTESTNREVDALRDKANLALGYAMLQANRAAESRPALERVRLEGPQSTRALLGVGWAASAAGDYRGALVPWLELHGRNLLDPAVQESYLAVPYAYAKLSANGQAVEAYEAAIREFTAESTRLDESIEAIRRGGLLDAVLRSEKAGERFNVAADTVAAAPESRYLYHLLAQNEFQEGLKNYRSLRQIDTSLAQWSTSIDAFDEMLATRRESFQTKLPAILAKLDKVDLDDLQKRRTEDESRVVAADESGDFAVLGTPREREMWADIGRIEATLASAPAGDADDEDRADLESLRERLHLVKGVLYWQLSDGFKARVWSARRGLRDVSQALRETTKRWALVKEARVASPARTEEFAARVATLRPRIEEAHQKLAALRDKQGAFLADIAVRELQSQKERLTTYMLQARYSLATIYDRAAAGDEKHADPAPDAGAPR
jgi:hypothetical protein